ncbi:secretin N-terminal domain-containing protein [Luteitalea sp.]|uniref:secretin N-terminal domain-containing protein n=1 Tax=Luteitalea sp. TaxID=2004800 RepID=UPI0025C13651|nr:secretin N-terminal domain-containing protein [Luteitalea sp.]
MSSRRSEFDQVRIVTRLTLALLVAATLSACATNPKPYRVGQLAEQRDDFDQAIVAYTQAQVADPDNREIALALKRAKLRASASHHSKGRRLAGAGKYEEALVEFQLALEFNPANSDAEDAVREMRVALRTKMAVRKDGGTQLESLISRARALPPEGRDLPELTLPDSLVFRDAGSRDVFTSLARFAGISLVFDPQFRSVPVSIDLRGSTLPDALDAIGKATGTFWRVSAPKTVTVVPDTAAKRREYEEEVIRTFYLSNADLKETLDLLRIVVDARRLSPITATNAISIKDTPERIEAASRLLAAIDKARAEVVIEVELLEVARTRFKQYGIQILSPGNETGLAGQVDANQEGGLTLEQLTNLGKGDIFFTNLPGLYYRLLKADSDTRTLANPQLRTSDGLPAQAKFGEEVPVPQVTFAPIATGGVNQQPITSFTYRNVGVNIDITPRTHHNDDVTLAVKIEISSLSGTGYSGLPTFGTRSITTTIRLRDGETNLLAGLIRDNERTVLRGIPGLSDIPVIGRIFASNERETQQTDVVLMLTPRIIRVLDLTEEDLRPFLAGRGGGPAAASFDVPSVTPLPLRPAQPPPDGDGAGSQPFFPQLPAIPEQRTVPTPTPRTLPPAPPPPTPPGV